MKSRRRPTPARDNVVPLFGVFRDGRRVYLPPANAPGVERDEAERLARGLGNGAEVVEVFTPPDPEAA